MDQQNQVNPSINPSINVVRASEASISMMDLLKLVPPTFVFQTQNQEQKQEQKQEENQNPPKLKEFVYRYHRLQNGIITGVVWMRQDSPIRSQPNFDFKAFATEIAKKLIRLQFLLENDGFLLLCDSDYTILHNTAMRLGQIVMGVGIAGQYLGDPDADFKLTEQASLCLRRLFQS